MRRRRSFYVGLAIVYALAVYLALALGQSRAESVEILAVVIIVSAAAGSVAWRFATGLESAVGDAVRDREELALVGRLSAGLSGPLKPAEVATAFLDGIKGALPPSAVATLLQYEESAGAVRILAQQGTATLPREGITYPIGRRHHPVHRVFDDAADSGKPLVSSTPSNVGAMSIRDLAAQITVAAPVQH